MQRNLVGYGFHRNFDSFLGIPLRLAGYDLHGDFHNWGSIFGVLNFGKEVLFGLDAAGKIFVRGLQNLVGDLALFGDCGNVFYARGLVVPSTI